MIDKTAHSTTYQGGDEQSVFPIPFPFLESSHIEARLRTGTEPWRTLAAGVDYAINRISDGNGEFILLGDALPADAVLEITRRVPLTQEILFHNQGPNSPRAMEEAVDKLTMIAQQQSEGNESMVAELAGRFATTVAEMHEALSGQNESLAGKAEKIHGHDMGAVSGLAAALGAKADAAAVAQALADKADASVLVGKAPVHHSHALADIGGLPVTLSSLTETQGDLADALSGKAAAGHRHTIADVTGLSSALGPHAGSHAAGGGDAVTPSAIGAQPEPPADGKSYLATAGGWVEYLAPTGGGEGGTSDHAQLTNREAANQHPQSAIQNLVGDLAAINAELDGLDGSLTGMQAALAAKADRSELPAVTDADIADILSDLEDKVDRSDLPGLATHNVSGLMSAADKLKLDGLSSGGGTGSGSSVPGKIELWPFRPADLPSGWYFANGDTYAVASAVGQALSALPERYRADWSIVSEGGYINLPDLFSNGDGYFLRPVDGVSRQVGSAQTDAIRNLTGNTGGGGLTGKIPVSGVFYHTGAATMGPSSGSGSYAVSAMDASLSVPTAHENRPLNIGMTPAVYLGV